MHHNDICVNHAQSQMQIFRDILWMIFSVELKGNSVFTLYTISICSWRTARIAVFFGTIILCTLFGSSSIVFSNKFQDI